MRDGTRSGSGGDPNALAFPRTGSAFWRPLWGSLQNERLPVNHICPLDLAINAPSSRLGVFAASSLPQQQADERIVLPHLKTPGSSISMATPFTLKLWLHPQPPELPALKIPKRDEGGRMDGYGERANGKNLLEARSPAWHRELTSIPLCRRVVLRGAAVGAFLLPPPSGPLFGVLLHTPQNALLWG